MERWRQEDPARNIGVRVADDETFVDIDTQAAHDRSRERCPVDTTTSRTPRGGWHLRYSGPAKSRVLIKDGDDRLLEVKSARTNVVGVGSIVNGRTYRWEKPPWEVPPAPLPAELVARINETRTVSIYEADQYGVDALVDEIRPRT